MNEKELEGTNINFTCDNEAIRHKETLSTNENEGKEKTLNMSENKEKSRDGYVSMSERGKHFCHSTYE